MGYLTLLIEDNPDHAMLTRRALMRDSRVSDVEVCENATRALDRLVDSSRPKPSLILVDMRLPGLSGLDFVERARRLSQLRGIPIVIVSAAARECEVKEGMFRGACAFISKPLRVADLMRRLESAGYPPAGPIPVNGSEDEPETTRTRAARGRRGASEDRPS